MDLGLTESELKFRDDLRTWLKANLPSKANQVVKSAESMTEYYAYLKSWQRKLYDGGYAGINWPKEYGGRGASFIEQAIFQEEMARADAPEPDPEAAVLAAERARESPERRVDR
jgi:alkylation response protein AidB-like acyl-CoA dehydrogenase